MMNENNEFTKKISRCQWFFSWTKLKLKPLFFNGRCVGSRSIAFILFKKKHKATLTSYWKNVRLKKQTELISGELPLHENKIKMNFWKLEIRKGWGTLAQPVFEEGEFKAKLVIDGKIEKETDWIKYTKNSRF